MANKGGSSVAVAARPPVRGGDREGEQDRRRKRRRWRQGRRRRPRGRDTGREEGGDSAIPLRPVKKTEREPFLFLLLRKFQPFFPLLPSPPSSSSIRADRISEITVSSSSSSSFPSCGLPSFPLPLSPFCIRSSPPRRRKNRRRGGNKSGRRRDRRKEGGGRTGPPSLHIFDAFLPSFPFSSNHHQLCEKGREIRRRRRGQQLSDHLDRAKKKPSRTSDGGSITA